MQILFDQCPHITLIALSHIDRPAQVDLYKTGIGLVLLAKSYITKTLIYIVLPSASHSL